MLLFCCVPHITMHIIMYKDCVPVCQWTTSGLPQQGHSICREWWKVIHAENFSTKTIYCIVLNKRTCINKRPLSSSWWNIPLNIPYPRAYTRSSGQRASPYFDKISFYNLASLNGNHGSHQRASPSFILISLETLCAYTREDTVG